jgi:lipoic acid synthetase
MVLEKKKIRIRRNDELRKKISGLRLNTVCTESLCPNISECHENNCATFFILGKICTRNCRFCSVKKGIPLLPDYEEPLRVAEAAARLGLNYIVITSPTREDLLDGGAEIFAQTVMEIKTRNKKIKVEILIPDFNEEGIIKVAQAGPDVVSHNLETIRRLYEIREGADYERSLGVLKRIKECSGSIKTKSAIMLGLGETREEVAEFMRDLIEAGCTYLSIGQYLAPTRKHYPVREYITREKFDEYKKMAISMGFAHVESGKYVRSSYHAESYMQ